MLKYTPRFFIFILLFFTAHTSVAQFFPPKNYPRQYFEYPVVAAKAYVANFGELRPNHYHMGYDCRTDQVQNKKIVAAADGYIARVKIEPWGFGRAIYINHPNGLTTLYAHLNGFYTELENYVKQQQYALKSWNVFLDIPSSLFPVKKGDTIALSGNTGGSQGPHLHFEIRDTKTDKVLNPSLFDFQIPDTIAPDIFKLAVYDRRFSTYEQTPKIFAVKKINGVYTVPSVIVTNTDKVSFGINTSDRYTRSSNRNGVYETVLYENDNAIVGFQLDSISYDETRYLNGHIDYKLRSSGGGFIEHVSKLPGYNNSVYKTSLNGDGAIAINDTSVHAIKIEVKDANGNTSVLKFNIKRNVNFVEPQRQFPASYYQAPVFHPGSVNVFENESIRFYMPANCLYDSIHFQYSQITPKQGYTIHQLHNATVPVQTYFPVTIKAEISNPDKVVMHRFANARHDYAKAEPVMNGKEIGWYKASFREFGSFELLVDTVAPAITPIGFKDGMNCSKQSRIVFVVRDNTEDLKFTAMLDGNWLRFSNDKGSRFIYDFDDMCPAGEHELKIIAEDQVGNMAEKVYKFTR